MGNDSSKPTTKIASSRQMEISQFVDEIENEELVDEHENDNHTTNGGVDSAQGGLTGSEFDPSKLLDRYTRTRSVVDATDAAALQIDPRHFEYSFENMVLEGGGNKGLAYCGAIKCFEDLGMMKQIKRIGGASAGAITAALVAFGYNSDEIKAFLSDDIESIFLDHSCGYLSLVPNLLRKFGWNPGNKIYKWFGDAIEEKSGNPDTTFYELYSSRGVELCVMVTNLNLMTAQYCHPKTTPNMPIRDALRMTMAIPGVFSAVEYENHGQTDVFVDGGVLCNYPINCFDGWYLSMDKSDSFLQKMRPLKDLPSIMASDNRFYLEGPNKTIGFLLFDESETEIMRFNLERRVGTLLPEKPRVETEIYKEKQKKLKEKAKVEREHARVVRAVEAFLSVLAKHNIDDQEFISKEELKSALNDEEFSVKNRELLFGKEYKLDAAFKILDKDGNNKIAYHELIQFIEERGIRMQVRFIGYSRKEVQSFGAFLSALQGTLLTNLKYVAVTKEDEERTVGINTGHVGTMDYTIEEEDRDFVVERGYNATLSFLRYYAAKNPTLVKRRKFDVLDTQPMGNESFDTETTNDKDALMKRDATN